VEAGRKPEMSVQQRAGAAEERQRRVLVHGRLVYNSELTKLALPAARLLSQGSMFQGSMVLWFQGSKVLPFGDRLTEPRTMER
jgi:hypothetical protein